MCPMKLTPVQSPCHSGRGREINEAVLTQARPASPTQKQREHSLPPRRAGHAAVPKQGGSVPNTPAVLTQDADKTASSTCSSSAAPTTRRRGRGEGGLQAGFSLAERLVGGAEA